MKKKISVILFVCFLSMITTVVFGADSNRTYSFDFQNGVTTYTIEDFEIQIPKAWKEVESSYEDAIKRFDKDTGNFLIIYSVPEIDKPKTINAQYKLLEKYNELYNTTNYNSFCKEPVTFQNDYYYGCCTYRDFKNKSDNVYTFLHVLLVDKQSHSVYLICFHSFLFDDYDCSYDFISILSSIHPIGKPVCKIPKSMQDSLYKIMDLNLSLTNNSGDPIVGTWQSEYVKLSSTDDLTAYSEALLVFKSNGAFQLDFVINDEEPLIGKWKRDKEPVGGLEEYNFVYDLYENNSFVGRCMIDEEDNNLYIHILDNLSFVMSKKNGSSSSSSSSSSLPTVASLDEYGKAAVIAGEWAKSMLSDPSSFLLGNTRVVKNALNVYYVEMQAYGSNGSGGTGSLTFYVDVVKNKNGYWEACSDAAVRLGDINAYMNYVEMMFNNAVDIGYDVITVDSQNVNYLISIDADASHID